MPYNYVKDVNQVVLEGTVGKDPKFIENERYVMARFSLSTVRSSKNRDGAWVKIYTWHRVLAWGDVAKEMRDISRGERWRIEGRIEENNWEKDGVKRKSTQIRAFVAIRLSNSLDAPGPSPAIPVPDNFDAKGSDEEPW